MESNKDLTFTWWFLKLNTTLCGWQLLSVVGDQHFLGRPAQLQERAIPPKENKAPKKDSHHKQGIVKIHRGRSYKVVQVHWYLILCLVVEVCTWLSNVVHVCTRLYMVLNACPSLYMVVENCPWQYKVVHGFYKVIQDCTCPLCIFLNPCTTI